MPYTFDAEQWLPYPIEHVFAFFSNPENLPRLMPPWQKARIEEASFVPPPARPVPAHPRLRFGGIAAGKGTKITMSFRPFPYSPVRLPWEAEIAEFAWNEHFCDIALRSPFRYWKHCHRIRPEARDGKPGTLLHDHVDYEMFGGPFGAIGQKIFITGQLKSTFEFRQKRTAELLPLMQPLG